MPHACASSSLIFNARSKHENTFKPYGLNMHFFLSDGLRISSTNVLYLLLKDLNNRSPAELWKKINCTNYCREVCSYYCLLGVTVIFTKMITFCNVLGFKLSQREKRKVNGIFVHSFSSFWLSLSLSPLSLLLVWTNKHTEDVYHTHLGKNNMICSLQEGTETWMFAYRAGRGDTFWTHFHLLKMRRELDVVGDS